jgi:outer membrane protein OmpA-like peptidoglycan-associated protein
MMGKIFRVTIILFVAVTNLFGQQDSVKISIYNLGNQVNSEFNEYSPVIAADGSLMLFASRKPFTEKEKKKNKQSMEMIYMSTYNSSTKSWREPAVAPAPINAPGRNNVVLGLSNDGQRMMIYRDDESGNGNIWESRLEGVTWSEPVALPEPVNSAYHESSASLAPDGKTLYFCSNRPGGLGGRDIWISTVNAEGKWSEPINAGPSINTAEDEEGVFMHPDGTTLYFSSKGRGGQGGYDVYQSHRVKGMWTAAENLGSIINTKGDDIFFQLRADGTKAYYSSSGHSSGKGEKDIYEVVFTPIEKKKETGPRLTLLKGILLDSASRKPIGGRIDIYDNEKNELITSVMANSATGNFLVSLPAGKNYNITATSAGYLFHSENFNIPDTARYQEVYKEIELQKLEVGSKIILNNIFFDYNKATLRPESYTELNNLLQLLRQNPSMTIEISGHTDNRGTAEYNKRLSEARAKAVVDYLIGQGISDTRLRYAGYGFEQPIAPNTTEANMQLNRRVEFKILSK